MINFLKYNGLKIHKKWEKCWISKINVLSNWNISKSFHWNILITTPFYLPVFRALSSGTIHFYIWANLKIAILAYEGFDWTFAPFRPKNTISTGIWILNFFVVKMWHTKITDNQKLYLLQFVLGVVLFHLKMTTTNYALPSTSKLHWNP